MSDAQPKAAADILTIGEEQRKVVVIDGFVVAPETFVAEASGLAYSDIGGFYPGVRAPFALTRMDALLAPYQSELRDVFQAGCDFQAIECHYSLVSTPPEALHPLQRIPHIDTTEPHRLAVLIYLCGEEFGGTAFYRHRSTGFEFIDAARRAVYNDTLDADVARFGVPEARYIADDTAMFKEIARFAARPGRALIYSVQSLHSGLIGAPERLSVDPRLGRLTLNAFVSAA